MHACMYLFLFLLSLLILLSLLLLLLLLLLWFYVAVVVVAVVVPAAAVAVVVAVVVVTVSPRQFEKKNDITNSLPCQGDIHQFLTIDIDGKRNRVNIHPRRLSIFQITQSASFTPLEIIYQPILHLFYSSFLQLLLFLFYLNAGEPRGLSIGGLAVITRSLSLTVCMTF